jgi:hypothetical protein
MRRALKGASDRSIRVPMDTYGLLQQIVARIARDGWHSLGEDRTDTPTIRSVVDAAIRRLGRS